MKTSLRATGGFLLLLAAVLVTGQTPRGASDATAYVASRPLDAGAMFVGLPSERFVAVTAGDSAEVPVAPPPSAAQPVWNATMVSPPSITAHQALVFDEGSGSQLYALGAHVRAEPASLTKIVTAVVALERGNLDEMVTVDVDSRQMPGSTLMGLRPDDRFSLRDLLFGLMLPSGNDAALAIARHVSGSDRAFVDEMNAFAQRLGLADTHFDNPHGLPGRTHFTSAHDLAKISRYAMAIPMFRTIVQAPTYRAIGSRAIGMQNLMSDAFSTVAGADGVKSGFTDRAGRTAVTSATRDGHRVYVVLLDDPNREADTVNLLQWAFSAFNWPPEAVVAEPASQTSTAAAPAPAPLPGDDIVHAARAK